MKLSLPEIREESLKLKLQLRTLKKCMPTNWN